MKWLAIAGTSGTDASTDRGNSIGNRPRRAARSAYRLRLIPDVTKIAGPKDRSRGRFSGSISGAGNSVANVLDHVLKIGLFLLGQRIQALAVDGFDFGNGLAVYLPPVRRQANIDFASVLLVFVATNEATLLELFKGYNRSWSSHPHFFGQLALDQTVQVPQRPKQRPQAE